MVAYKVLNAGRSELTGTQWPLPSAGEPGAWVCAEGPLELCVNGIHACTPEQLPQWLGPDIWEIELDGDILHAEPALVASRGRLVRTVPGWTDEVRRAFSRACAERAREFAAAYAPGVPLSERIAGFAEGGWAAACGYWTALLAGESVTGTRAGAEYDAAFAAERARQAQWLVRELALSPARR